MVQARGIQTCFEAKIMKFMSEQKITVLTTSVISPLFRYICTLDASVDPLGEPSGGYWKKPAPQVPIGFIWVGTG